MTNEEQLALSARVGVLEQQVAELPVIKSVWIYDLSTSDLVLRGPLNVTLEIYADEVVASWSEVGAFATGITEAEALLGLKEEIATLADELFAFDDVELGKLLLSQKRALAAMVERRATA
jgi:hypothetical protein